MAGLVPAIHVFLACGAKDVEARHKAGHDDALQKLWFRRLPVESSSRDDGPKVRDPAISRRPWPEICMDLVSINANLGPSA